MFQSPVTVLGIPGEIAKSSLLAPERAGIIVNDHGQLRIAAPLLTDTRRDMESAQQLRRHWVAVATERLASPRADDLFSYNVFACPLGTVAQCAGPIRPVFAQLGSGHVPLRGARGAFQTPMGRLLVARRMLGEEARQGAQGTDTERSHSMYSLGRHPNGTHLALAAAIGVASTVACSGQGHAGDDVDAGGSVMSDGRSLAEESAGAELGQATQELWGYGSHDTWSYNESSCSDPTGTDSVLAALAVATATELRRWQPVLDFQEVNGMLALTSRGKMRCADGECFNTQALLDLQKSSASNAEVRPGVRVNPSTLRLRLTWNHSQQIKCRYSWWNRCVAPEHEFRFLHSEPGACDVNYWFAVLDRDGNPLEARLNDLIDQLIWVDVEDNSYIQFQAEGSTIAIDPTYGLNEAGSTSAGSCSAACTMISSTNIAGRCCSCNGTRSYKRAIWSANAYLCQ